MPILEKSPQKTEAKATSTDEDQVSALENPFSFLLFTYNWLPEESAGDRPQYLSPLLS